MNNGCRNKNQFLQIPVTHREGRFMIRICLFTIRKIRSIHFSSGYPPLTRTGCKRPVSGKAKERNISGRKSLCLQMTGTSILWQKNGGHRGQNTATDIWNPDIKSTTGAIKGRALMHNLRSMRVLQLGRWRTRGKQRTDVRLTGR